jgi:hypothetical protein
MEFKALRADGRIGGEGRYTAMLPAMPDARALAALAESAVDASAGALNDWAQAHAAPVARLAAAAND